jgi:hypothetical protein
VEKEPVIVHAAPSEWHGAKDAQVGQRSLVLSHAAVQRVRRKVDNRRDSSDLAEVKAGGDVETDEPVDCWHVAHVRVAHAPLLHRGDDAIEDIVA